VGFVIDNLRLPQVEQCKLEKEEMHDEESKTFCLEASKNEIVPYNVGKFFLTFLPGVVVCAACEVQFY